MNETHTILLKLKEDFNKGLSFDPTPNKESMYVNKKNDQCFYGVCIAGVLEQSDLSQLADSYELDHLMNRYSLAHLPLDMQEKFIVYIREKLDYIIHKVETDITYNLMVIFDNTSATWDDMNEILDWLIQEAGNYE